MARHIEKLQKKSSRKKAAFFRKHLAADKITYSNSSVDQLDTLPKASLQCIFNVLEQLILVK